MEHGSCDSEAPQFIPPPTPWDRDSQATISAGLHPYEEWEQHLTSPLDRGSIAARVPYWLVHQILELIRSSPSYTDALGDHILSALYEQDLDGLEQRGCSCNGHPPSSAPLTLPGSCSWCRAKSRLGNIKQVGSFIRRALSNAGRHMRPRKSSERGASPSTSACGLYQASASSTAHRLPECEASATTLQEPKETAAHTILVAELPADFTHELQDTSMQRLELDAGTTFEGAWVPTGSGVTEWACSDVVAAASTTPERSTTLVSMLSGSSVATKARHSLVSRSSRSTTSTELTRISTDQTTILGKDVVDSPTSFEDATGDDVAPWPIEGVSLRQDPWTSPTPTMRADEALVHRGSEDNPARQDSWNSSASTQVEPPTVPEDSLDRMLWTSSSVPVALGLATRPSTAVLLSPSSLQLPLETFRDLPPRYTAVDNFLMCDNSNSSLHSPAYSMQMPPGSQRRHSQERRQGYHPGTPELGLQLGPFGYLAQSDTAMGLDSATWPNFANEMAPNTLPDTAMHTLRNSMMPIVGSLTTPTAKIAMEPTVGTAMLVGITRDVYHQMNGHYVSGPPPPTAQSPCGQSMTSFHGTQSTHQPLHGYGQSTPAAGRAASLEGKYARDKQPSQSAVASLPSVQKSMQTSKPAVLKRSYPPDRDTECKLCNFTPSGPRIVKKLRRHYASNKHRLKKNQRLTTKMLCGSRKRDGSTCMRSFNRRDNLQQHRRKKHGQALTPTNRNQPSRESTQNSADNMGGPVPRQKSFG